MKVESRKRLVAAVVSFCLAAFLASAGGSTACGQDSAEAKPAVEKKAPAKPRGRLPMYYAPVVSEKQREQIYAIQAKYADQIEQLQKQLDELKERRDGEVEAVLSPEQLAKVKQARDAAAAKRSAASEAKAETEK
jgi:hypothetical protein